MSLFRKILYYCNLRFESQEAETSFSGFQKIIQTKLFFVIRIIVVIFLSISFASSIVHHHPYQDIIFKASLPISILFVSFLKGALVDLHRSLFIIIYWLVGFHFPQRMLDHYGKENRTALFFVGYLMGISEVIMVVSIKRPSYRILLQAMLIFAKISNFYQHLSDEPKMNFSLWIISVIAIFFFLYHNGLDRHTFKIMHDICQKLQKFQTFLADDFPISVIMITANLNTLIYYNQTFASTFGYMHNTHSPDRFIRSLFRNIFLESETKIGTTVQENPNTAHFGDTETEKVSFFNFIQSIRSLIPQDPKETSIHGKIFSVYGNYRRSPEESLLHFEIKLRTILWENQIAYTVIISDVSDKQKVLALRMADEQRDRVIATISHELKTPINGILGLLDMLSNKNQDKQSVEYLEHSKSCSRLLLYFVNSILDLTQLRRDQLQLDKAHFSLDGLLEEMKSLYVHTSEHKKIQFSIEKEKDVEKLDSIYTDRYRLAEVLMILLGNAMKFTFKGFVTFRIALMDKNILGQPQKKRLRFTVEDSGVGIKEKDKTNLFRLFGKMNKFETNINLYGAGLGLSTANQLVNVLNGSPDFYQEEEKLSFESKVREGSKFWFSVDITPPHDEKIEEEVVIRKRNKEDLRSRSLRERQIPVEFGLLNEDEAVGGGGSDKKSRRINSESNIDGKEKGNVQDRILIVDDNAFNLMAARFIVKKLGFEAETADNGEECLKKLEKSNGSVEEKFKLVLMDIQMPVMDGIEATNIINEKIRRGRTYPVAVVALTAKQIDEKERRTYQECGMFDALAKPLVKDELMRIIKRIDENGRSEVVKSG